MIQFIFLVSINKLIKLNSLVGDLSSFHPPALAMFTLVPIKHQTCCVILYVQITNGRACNNRIDQCKSYRVIHFVVSKVWHWNSTSIKLCSESNFFSFLLKVDIDENGSLNYNATHKMIKAI